MFFFIKHGKYIRLSPLLPLFPLLPPAELVMVVGMHFFGTKAVGDVSFQCRQQQLKILQTIQSYSTNKIQHLDLYPMD